MLNFRKDVSLSVNEKHFSNTQESLKLIEDIINPYVKEERKRLGRKSDQMVLLIIDVFRGQMAETVINILKEYNICLIKVSVNITGIFQPHKFTQWYMSQIQRGMESGKDIDEIEVKLNLTTLKPLHAAWIMEFYNLMVSD